MSQNKKHNEDTDEQKINNTQETENAAEETTKQAEANEANEATEKEEAKEPTPEETIADLNKQLEESKKEYLFLMAEFDNFRKRTLREKAELIRNGAEKALGDILPIVDDFERAVKANEKADDINAVKEGFGLIYNKFIKYLEKNQVKAMESTGNDFDTELHEAVTTFPVDDEAKKGKVIDTVLTGYTINDKVLRHAKVVVGQ
ncbi:MAG: nucleotide exchange factor GrpE [Bacteroidales bacterium]|nr:nucleotide exchange factor GrpE [Bacteroidales bacterium]